MSNEMESKDFLVSLEVHLRIDRETWKVLTLLNVCCLIIKKRKNDRTVLKN